MNEAKRKKVEFGDFQTPDALARSVCVRLREMGINPDAIVEPTCGVGAFVKAAAAEFPHAEVHGYEINADYLEVLAASLARQAARRVRLHRADFFATDWRQELSGHPGRVLVIGNLPWVTSAVLGAIGGANLPQKSNFLSHKGLEAITGKANFDISEWMIIEMMRWLASRPADLAMLIKSATARKVIAHAERMGLGVTAATIIGIDAKHEFNASVDACLLVMQFSGVQGAAGVDYDVFASMADSTPTRVGHRNGLTVGDLDRFQANMHMVGDSPQKWRSGVKHDASQVMEFSLVEGRMENGLGKCAKLESTYLYPLMKGSDIGSNKEWRRKYVLVTQRRTGEPTDHIAQDAPKTWDYLLEHGQALDARGSSIYTKGPRFAIFGIGDYAFRPWRIAICGLYKKLNFRIIGPIENKPVMLDDTVYFVSFDTEAECLTAYKAITSKSALELYASLIFWDEKRPIKSSVLNNVDWTKCSEGAR